ncbi:LCP family protein [Streptomyces sp. NPDC058735]|uniref:LCP family protein n=1 Tax=Streptomyces sp. NPDC058735 TaxID=3346616 RepID=UPI003687527A
MNDRYEAGAAGHGADPYELVGYDEYGRPVYRQVQARQQTYDPYAQQPPPAYDYGAGQQQHYGQGHDHDAYGAGAGQQQTGPQDPYGGPSRAAAHTARQAPEQTPHIPQQAGPADRDEAPAEPREDYRTEQFAFVEEPDGDSEDVIDWLKFTENRTERREEARRRARSRIVALAVVLALVAVGGFGYLWYAGKLPGLSSDGSEEGTATAAGAQKRDVIVVHLHDTKGGGTSTALLVDNTTTEEGATVLLPNALALTGDDGTTTTLAESVDDDGPDATREALDSVLGTDIEGTWRLDTPYLQNLVDLVGTVDVDTDTDVPDPQAEKKGQAPLVKQGEDQSLSGKAAVAYATYRASGEAQNAQLERFGQVMQAVLRKMSSDPQAATTTIETLAQILDPPLTDKDLGSFLAGLSDHAKGGDYATDLLPVRADGTLSAQAGADVVKKVLGGTAKSPDKDAAVSVSVQNATGVEDRTEKARVVLLNGGFTFLEGGTAGARATSKVVYADAGDKADAAEVARTLGLPETSVTRGSSPAGADVSVVLGQDYEPSSD